MSENASPLEALRQRPAQPLSREDALKIAAVDLFRDVIAGSRPGAPIGQTLDFWLSAADPGRVVMHGEPHPRFFNPVGTVHGGWAATLLDSCMTCAFHSTLPAGQATTTVELKINYIRPITLKTGRVTAEGKVIHAGKTLGTAEGKLTDAAGNLLAHGTTTCMVITL